MGGRQLKTPRTNSFSYNFIVVECEANTETEFDIIISTSLVERQCWFDAPDVCHASYNLNIFVINSIIFTQVQKAYDILESQQRAQNQSAQVVHKYQIDGTCPHHLIVLEIPNTEIQGAVSNALTSDKTTVKPGDTTSQLTAKSPADTMKNAKHPLSVSLENLWVRACVWSVFAVNFMNHKSIYSRTLLYRLSDYFKGNTRMAMKCELLGPICEYLKKSFNL